MITELDYLRWSCKMSRLEIMKIEVNIRACEHE